MCRAYLRFNGLMRRVGYIVFTGDTGAMREPGLVNTGSPAGLSEMNSMIYMYEKSSSSDPSSLIYMDFKWTVGADIEAKTISRLDISA